MLDTFRKYSEIHKYSVFRSELRKYGSDFTRTETFIGQLLAAVQMKCAGRRHDLPTSCLLFRVAFLSRYMKKPCVLLFCSTKSLRCTKNKDRGAL